MLKFEKIAKVGDVIRAYDFKPMAGREDCYVEGKVLELTNVNGYLAFEILTTRDVWAGERLEEGRDSRVGKLTHVPAQVSFMEYDARIINLSD
jgi:hypothetical protein